MTMKQIKRGLRTNWSRPCSLGGNGWLHWGSWVIWFSIVNIFKVSYLRQNYHVSIYENKNYRWVWKYIFFSDISFSVYTHFKLYWSNYLFVYHLICHFLILFVSAVLIKGSNVVIFFRVFITQTGIKSLYYICKTGNITPLLSTSFG